MVSYDVANQKVGMISIPRDTAVNRDWRKDPKINGAYAGAGVDVLKEEIEQTFGIPIDYYIYVDLKGFVALVDELEGVDVYIPEEMNYDDPYQDLHIHYTKGQHHLNGQQAMEPARQWEWTWIPASPRALWRAGARAWSGDTNTALSSRRRTSCPP